MNKHRSKKIKLVVSNEELYEIMYINFINELNDTCVWNGINHDTDIIPERNVWIKNNNVLIKQLAKELVIDLQQELNPINVIKNPVSSWIREKLDEIDGWREHTTETE